MNYVTEPTEYVIEVRQRHAADTSYAHCRALGLRASCTAGAHFAAEACARKIVAMVSPGAVYTARHFAGQTWLCKVVPASPPQVSAFRPQPSPICAHTPASAVQSPEVSHP